jgi:hypothetical protein
MKLAAGVLAAICLVLAAAPSEARGFNRKGRKLPKPIDYPIVRKKVREDHKSGKRAGQHPEQYLRPGWGRQTRQIFEIPPSHFGQHFFYDRYE